MRLLALPLALSIMLAGCGDSAALTSTSGDEAGRVGDVMSDPAANGPAPHPALAATTPFAVQACKAAIAALNGRDPATMKAGKLADDLVHVSYLRSDVGKRWQSRRRIDDANPQDAGAEAKDECLARQVRDADPSRPRRR